MNLAKTITKANRRRSDFETSRTYRIWVSPDPYKDGEYSGPPNRIPIQRIKNPHLVNIIKHLLTHKWKPGAATTRHNRWLCRLQKEAIKRKLYVVVGQYSVWPKQKSNPPRALWLN